jgi:hypothetical protein
MPCYCDALSAFPPSAVLLLLLFLSASAALLSPLPASGCGSALHTPITLVRSYSDAAPFTVLN